MSETFKQMQARWRDQEAAQDFINELWNDPYRGDDRWVEQEIRSTAAQQHEGLPQYVGAFDGPNWRLAKITRRMRTKGGVRFEKGDVVIVDLTVREPDFPGDVCYPTAYSVRGACRVSTPTTYFRVV